MVLTRQRVPPW